jgi:hypothetical protein
MVQSAGIPAPATLLVFIGFQLIRSERMRRVREGPLAFLRENL